MMLKIAAAVLLCSCLGHCCYPETMNGQIHFDFVQYTFAVNFTAGLNVQYTNYNRTYRAHFFNRNFHYRVGADPHCLVANDTDFFQPIPSAIPKDATIVAETDNSITYSYSVFGRHDVVTVTKSTPCFPMRANYTYTSVEGTYQVPFFAVKEGVNSGYRKVYYKYLEDCKEVHKSFEEYLG